MAADIVNQNKMIKIAKPSAIVCAMKGRLYT